MANCPSCGAEINKLYLLDKGNIAAFIAPNGDLDYVYEDIDEDEEDEDEDTYSCPCCNAIVAHDDDEALQILSGI